MSNLSTSKLVLLVIGLVAILGVVYFFLNTTETQNSTSINITDSHSRLNVTENPSFSFNDFDEATKQTLANNNITSLNIGLTENPTATLTSSYDNNNQLFEYVGYEVNKEERNLNVNLYFNTEALVRKEIDYNELSTELTQQLILALKSFQLNQSTNGTLTLDASNETINDRFYRSLEIAQQLSENNRLPFKVSQQ